MAHVHIGLEQFLHRGREIFYYGAEVAVHGQGDQGVSGQNLSSLRMNT